MKEKTGIDQSVSHKYEIAFCVFLVALAFLYRDNPYLIYPQVLYLFGALLTLNLAAGWALRMWPTRPWISLLIILGNCGVITAIMSYSGEHESNLWVLYLLPIYTSCLLLRGQEVILTLLGIMCFNVAFHVLITEAMGPTAMFNLILKIGLYIFAAAATWRISQKDRKTQEQLLAQTGELQKIEARLEQQNGDLKEFEKLADMGQLTSGIIHDLRNPISVVVGTVSALLEDPNALGCYKPNLELIARAARLCQTITSNVMTVTGAKELQLVRCNVNETLESAVQLYGPTMAQSGIRIEKNCAPDLPPIAGSPVHLERVLLNLMANARAAMNGRGVLKVSTRKTEPLKSFGCHGVEIVLEDTGPGFAPDVLARVFKPFNTTKAPGEGTGLGLYLCREIILKHNGRLQVENRAEGGARFVLSLPSLETQVVLSVPDPFPSLS